MSGHRYTPSPWWWSVLIALTLLAAVCAMTEEYRSQIRDLQRRIAVLESSHPHQNDTK